MKILDQKDFYEAGVAAGRLGKLDYEHDRKKFKEWAKDDDVKKYYHALLCGDLNYALSGNTHDRYLFSKYANHFYEEKVRTRENVERKFPEGAIHEIHDYYHVRFPTYETPSLAVQKIAARYPNGKIKTETSEMDHDDYVRIAADHMLRGVIDGVNEP